MSNGDRVRAAMGMRRRTGDRVEGGGAFTPAEQLGHCAKVRAGERVREASDGTEGELWLDIPSRDRHNDTHTQADREIMYATQEGWRGVRSRK